MFHGILLIEYSGISDGRRIKWYDKWVRSLQVANTLSLSIWKSNLQTHPVSIKSNLIWNIFWELSSMHISWTSSYKIARLRSVGLVPSKYTFSYLYLVVICPRV